MKHFKGQSKRAKTKTTKRKTRKKESPIHIKYTKASPKDYCHTRAGKSTKKLESISIKWQAHINIHN